MLEYMTIAELTCAAREQGKKLSEVVLADQSAQMEMEEKELYARMERSLDVMQEAIKAGMDPLKLKKEYGDRLVLHGGINAVLWDDADAIIDEIDRLVPALKENGGFIFSSDHSIPNSVSLENFRRIVEEVKRVGSYN